MDHSSPSDQTKVEETVIDVGDLGPGLPDQPDITSDGYAFTCPFRDISSLTHRSQIEDRPGTETETEPATQSTEPDEQNPAVEKIPETPKHPSCALSNRAKELASRYERTQNMEHLQQAIDLATEAADTTPPEHHHAGRHLAGLAGHWKTRFERTRAVSDIDQSIECARAGMERTLADDPARFIYLNNLACCWNIKFTLTHAIEDLQRAISYARDTYAATPPGHRYRADCLGNLAMYLSNLAGITYRRYERSQDVDDIQLAILSAQDALASTPPEDSDRPGRLQSLAIYLGTRYERTGVLEDLQLSLVCMNEALALIGPTDPMRPRYLSTMSLQMGRQYERTDALEDIRQAVTYSVEALQSVQSTDPSWNVYLTNMAATLRAGYKRATPLGELQRAVLQEAILASTPQDEEDRARMLNSLAMDSVSFFSRTGDINELNRAIWYSYNLLALIAADHPKRPVAGDVLASMLYRRFTETGAIEDMATAITQYETAWGFTASPPSFRIAIALRLCNIFHDCPSDRPRDRTAVQSLLDECLPRLGPLLHASVLLLPLVSPRSFQRHDQQHNLAKLNGLPGDAAYAALAVGQSAYHALKLLELSRGLIMGFTIDCRGDLSDLQAASPELFHKFSQLRTEIDRPIPERSPHDLAHSTRFPGWEGVSNQDPSGPTPREQAIDDMETTIAQIRDLPGFDGFQLPPTEAQLMSLAIPGPIVVFNSTSIRSDALIVTSSRIRSIPLPQLINHEIPARLSGISKLVVGGPKTAAARNQKMREVLRWLWDVAVAPVVRELQLVRGAAELPHVWWIGVGAMSTAPFHAAGDYSPSADVMENTMGYAVSSYIATIKALSYAREKDFTLLDGPGGGAEQPQRKLLLVTMPVTPGAPKPKDLPGVTDEVAKIVEATHGAVATEHLEYPSVSDVLQQLQQEACAIMHFACHGVSNAADPSNSHLILVNDGEQDRLSVKDISRSNTRAQLAYLSACSTASNPAADLADEVIHIASGFQLAGFNHVMAALWPAESGVCTEVAADFYRALFDGAGGGGHRKIRMAWHEAVRAAQVKYRRTPVRWAQFVHLGA